MNLDQCVDLAMTAIPKAVQQGFLSGPVEAIQSGLPLSVTEAAHLADSREGGGACEGVSFLDDGVLLYAPTPDSRRENFTIAHELGHWAVAQTPEVYDWLADEADPLRMLETVCDGVAARLLLPGSVVGSIVGVGPVRARHLLALFDATSASRPACAIALAGFLSGMGAVAIIERFTRKIIHSSVRPDPARGWPRVFPWPGQLLATTHPLLQIGSSQSRTRRLAWETPWKTSADFYVDAIGDDRRVYAVFAANDLWEVDTFHPIDDRDFDARPSVTGHCCGIEFQTRGYPCSECGKPFCPTCKLCRCDRDTRRESRCSGCTMNFLPHLLVAGLCEECR